MHAISPAENACVPAESTRASKPEQNKKGLKKWLSLRRINGVYRQSADIGTHHNKKQQKEYRRLVRNSKGVIGDDSQYGRASLPAAERLATAEDRPLATSGTSSTEGTSSAANSPRENELLMLLLQRELKSTEISPAQAPSILSPDMAMQCSPLSSNRAGKGLRRIEHSVVSGQSSRSSPPRRKRSLIYAMYCTAKTDEHSTPEKADTGDLDRSPHQQATDQLVPQQGSILAALEHDLVPSYIANVQSWIRGSQSMATIDDSSAMFVSCTSMPNLQSPAANNQTIGMLTPRAGRRSMSIESVLADVAAQLSPVMSAIEDPIDSESDSEYITGSETGSSSRSSFVEITSVENEAYRCSGRFAPRLSTIERAHDGRLQIKPNDTPLQNAHALSPTESTPRFGAISEILAKDCTVGADSGNESATDASPQSETHAVPECGDDMTDICQVGGFPLAPNAICIQQRDKPNLFHGSNTGGDVTIADPSRILLSISLNSSESNGQDGVDPGNEQTSPELASPPMSPDRLRTVTVNTSVDTAETAKADSAPVSPISRKNGHSECDPYKADQQPSIESEPSSLMQQVVHNTIVHSETESERSIVGASEEAVSNTHGVELCDDSGLLSRHQRHAEGVGLSLFANENQISGSRMFSIFSDVSQSDMSLLNASQSLPDQYYGQFSQLSLLFDGHQQSIVQSVVGDTSSDGASAGLGVSQTATNTREYRGEIATAFSGNQFDNRGSTARGINRNAKNHNKGTECDDNGDDDDDEMALSEIIAINRAVISPPTPAQNSDAPDQPLSQEPKEPSEIQSGEPSSPEDDASNRPSFSSLASRTRKLSTALGSFRNLHRKIRSTATGAPGRAAAITDDSSSSGDGVNTHASHLSGGKEFRFNELVAVYETWNRDEYDRKGMPSAKLDSEAIEQIKHELNEFKVYEMQVHEDSRQHTHFIY